MLKKEEHCLIPKKHQLIHTWKLQRDFISLFYRFRFWKLWYSSVYLHGGFNIFLCIFMEVSISFCVSSWGFQYLSVFLQGVSISFCVSSGGFNIFLCIFMGVSISFCVSSWLFQYLSVYLQGVSISFCVSSWGFSISF